MPKLEESHAQAIDPVVRGNRHRRRAGRWRQKCVSDRKSTRLTPVTNEHLVCRLLLAKKKHNKQGNNIATVDTTPLLNIDLVLNDTKQRLSYLSISAL